MSWDSWWNVWRDRSLPQRRRVASGASRTRAADVAGAWSKQPIESLEDRVLLAAAGNLDSTFGTNGIATIEFGWVQSVAVDSNNQLIAVGMNNGDFALMRFNADGSLDTSFGDSGKRTTNFGSTSNDFATSVVIDTSGRIVVAGTSTTSTATSAQIRCAVARYNTDGSLDTTFGVNGKVTTGFLVGSGTTQYATDSYAAIDSSDRVVVAGRSDGGKFAVLRFTENGSLDSNFGVGGKVTTNMGADCYVSGMTIDSEDRIVVAGTRAIDGGVEIARYLEDGSLDPSFDLDGKLLDTRSTVTTARASIDGVAIDGNGKIIVAGTESGFYRRTFVARYNQDGSPDNSFAFDGDAVVATPKISTSDMTIDGNGRIVIAGTTNGDFAVVRFNVDGSLDEYFGNNGTAITDLNGTGDDPHSIAIDGDGNIVVAGMEYPGSGGAAQIGVVRYVGNGGPVFSIASAASPQSEGTGSESAFTFVVTRAANTDVEAAVDYVVTGIGINPADADDFGGELPSGTVNFAAGEISKTIAIGVSSDETVEYDERFAVTLANPRDGIISSKSNTAGTIPNDDVVDLSYATVDGIGTIVVSVSAGQLQVTLGGDLQPSVNPSAVHSLQIVGGDGADSLNLAGLSFSLYSHLTSIVLSGGGGDDTIIGSNFSELISGGSGDDVLRGGAGNDSVAGDNGNDTLDGEVGNDILSGGAGNDSLSGGGGTDRLVEEIAAPSNPAVVSMVKLARTDLKTKYTMTGLGADTISDIEEMSLAGSEGKDKIDVKKFRGSVTLSGNGGNDTLIGGAGNDRLDGGEGNDKLTGNGGTNQLDGGNGTDYVIEAGATNFVLTPSTLTGLGNDALHSIERASLTTANTSSRIDATAFRGVTILTGGSGNDTLLGGAGKDSISGGDGHDTIIGGAGYDTLLGGLGDDLLIGGLGKDSLDGEAGNDTGLGGQGGAARGGNGLMNSGDSLTGIELFDETLATLFLWE